MTPRSMFALVALFLVGACRAAPPVVVVDPIDTGDTGTATSPPGSPSGP